MSQNASGVLRRAEPCLQESQRRAQPEHTSKGCHAEHEQEARKSEGGEIEAPCTHNPNHHCPT